MSSLKVAGRCGVRVLCCAEYEEAGWFWHVVRRDEA